MKPKPSDFLETRRIKTGIMASNSTYGNNGAFSLMRTGVRLTVIVSDGGGWDHVSVSCTHRTPTWSEMCWIKDLFFEPEEAVVQYHPPASAYVNVHPNCLHMWRCQTADMPLPPAWMVGPLKARQPAPVEP